MTSFANFWKLYGRNMRQMPRIPTVLVFGIAMPIIQLLLLGSVFSGTLDSPAHPYNEANLGREITYYAFIAPAIILLTTFIGMANASAAFIVDLRTGYFDKLRTTPVTPAMVVFARLLAEMTRVMGQATIILFLALALGADIETGFIGAVAIVVLASLFSLMSTGLASTALAMKTKSDQATQSALPLFFVLIFLSTAFMPENLLPDWLQTAVQFNPVDYLIQGVRALMFESWADAVPEFGIGLAILLPVAALLAVVNWRVFRKTVA